MTSINVELPEPIANWDGSLTVWEVPLWDVVAEAMRRYPGQVRLRPSDGSISVECPSRLDKPADARALAAALLACAEAMDAGVRPLTAAERVAQLRGSA